MRLKIVKDDGTLLHVACEGEISWEQGGAPAADPLLQLLGPEGCRRKVLLDLEKTTYINSSGLSWLLVCHRHFQKDGGILVIHSVAPIVKQVIDFVNLHTILHFAPDEPSARALALGEKR
jgi:anti-anti-sigma factor